MNTFKTMMAIFYKYKLHVLALIIIAIILHPFWSHLIVFNDFGLFTSSSNQVAKLSTVWWDSFQGIYSFNSSIEALQFLFEWISFGNNLLAQFLFVFTFCSLGYFGFRKVLLILKINPILTWVIPFVYVFNPNTFIYSTGVLVFYNLIPYFFVLMWLLMHKYKYWQGFLLSLIIAICLANYQITFWNLGWFYLFFGILAILKMQNIKNYLLIIAHSIGGIFINLISIQPFLGYVQNVGNIDNQSYLQSFHGCYPALFWNLARIGANGCNLMGALGYIKDNYWNITGYILVIIIIIALCRWRGWKNALSLENRTILLMASSFVAFTLILAILLRFKILDFLIIQNNPIIVSLRNPVKLLEPFVFHYLIIVSLAFSFILTQWKQLYGYIFIVFFCTCMIIYSHPFLMPLWKYDTMNTQNYWVEFSGDGSFYRNPKYDVLDTKLSEIPENTYSLYLPMDLSIALKTAWQKKIFRDQSDIMRQKVDQNLAKKIYTNICNGEISKIKSLGLNINYIVIDKNPQTTFDHQSKAPIIYQNNGCQVEYDQVYHIWAKPQFFIDTLAGQSKFFENQDFVIYQISEQINSLYEIDNGIVSYEKDSSSQYKLQISINEPKQVAILFRNTYHPGWKIKIGERVYNAQEKDYNIYFQINMDKSESAIVYFEPQNTYLTLVSLSLSMFLIQIIPIALIYTKNNRKLTKDKT